MGTQNQSIQTQHSEEILGDLLEQIAEHTLTEMIRRNSNSEKQCQPQSGNGNLAEHLSERLKQAGYPRLNQRLFEEGAVERYFKVHSPVKKSPEFDRRVHNCQSHDMVQHRLWDCHFRSGVHLRAFQDHRSHEGFFVRFPSLIVEPFSDKAARRVSCLGKERYTFREAYAAHIDYYGHRTKEKVFSDLMMNYDHWGGSSRHVLDKYKTSSGDAEGIYNCTATIRTPSIPMDIEKEGSCAQGCYYNLFAEAVKQPVYQFQPAPAVKLYTVSVLDTHKEALDVEVEEFNLFKIRYQDLKGNRYEGVAYGNEPVNLSPEQEQVQIRNTEIYVLCPALILRIEKQPGVNKEHNHLIALWGDTEADQELKRLVKDRGG